MRPVLRLRAPITSPLRFLWLTPLLLTALVAGRQARAAEDAPLKDDVARLVQQLDDDERARRDDAEKQLVELGLADKGKTFLKHLPAANERMPQEMQARLERIRGKVQTHWASQAVVESRVTLNLKNAPLEEVLRELEKQSGNRLLDYREKFGQEATKKKVTVKVKDEPFWSALDKVLDEINMSPYAFSGEAALALVEREPNALRRSGRATYAGPFRIEATSVSAQRGMRTPDQSGLTVDLEISWEPRLEPLAISQAASDLKALCDDGLETPPTASDSVFNVEVSRGSHAVEATLALQLPSRKATQLKSLKGKLTALVPGQIVDLEFDDLAGASEVSKETGGVTVTLHRVVKNQALWEVHMRVATQSLQEGLDSNQGWVYQNVTYLVDKNGDKVDHAGYETTLQGDREAGFVYLFEIPDDISNYTWVYRTPTAIVNLPVEYELEEVPLP